jgi:energy-coupling factor transporter ATP-binding protein EcfA2
MNDEQPLSEVEVTITADAATSSASSSGHDHVDAEQSKELAIQTLLEIIDSNDIKIDDQLRRTILGQQAETPFQPFIPHNDDSNTTTPQQQRPSILRRGSQKSIRRSLLTKRESILGFFAHEVAERSTIEKEICQELKEKFGDDYFDGMSFECRVIDGSYSVDVPLFDENEEDLLQVEEHNDVEQQQQQQEQQRIKRRRSSINNQHHIPTVTNVGTIYKLLSSIKRFLSTGSCQQPYETKVIMKDVNLVFEEGKMYLILGAPGCGKSTLLKMIAGRLPESGNSGCCGAAAAGGCSSSSSCRRGGPKKIVGGQVQVNGVNSKDSDIVWSNVVSYVDQIERLHGYLTVKETVDFAFDCCWGGTHRGPFWVHGNPDSEALMQQIDEERWLVDLIMRAVGIKRVADTYVGNERVRGVSGGEKKRVSVAEMLAAKACEFFGTLFLCLVCELSLEIVVY